MQTRVVGVTFDVCSNKELNRLDQTYCFKSFLELELDDIVVVDTRNGYGVAKVTDPKVVDKKVIELANKWIISKVDLTEFEAAVKREEKLEELRKEMELRKSQVEADAVYRILAEKDEAMATLLKEFDELAGS